MKLLFTAATISLIATLSLAQTAPSDPPAKPVDVRAVGQDEQALIAAIRHNDENLGALIREVTALRAENARLSGELDKLKTAHPAVDAPPPASAK